MNEASRGKGSFHIRPVNSKTKYTAKMAHRNKDQEEESMASNLLTGVSTSF